MNAEAWLADPRTRDALIAACAAALDDEVANKSGITGMAIKSGFRAFKKVQPGIVPAAFGKLLPHFLPVVAPYQERAAASGDPAAYYAEHAPEVADGLLSVTDTLSERAKNQVLVALYRSMRSVARPQVVAAVPRIPQILASVTGPDPVV